jgi:hypothetical protein
MLLFAVAVLACAPSVLRAAPTHPMDALREE